MTRAWPLLGLVAVVGLIYLYGEEQRGAGRRDGERAARMAEMARLTVAARTADTVYARDTVRFREWRTRWDTVRARDTVSVRLPGDSVVVYVPRAVADSAVSSCETALQSCDVRVALRDTLISRLRAEIASRPVVVARPWSVSVLYDPIEQGYGALVTRDLWRLRAAAGVLPGRVVVGVGWTF